MFINDAFPVSAASLTSLGRLCYQARGPCQQMGLPDLGPLVCPPLLLQRSCQVQGCDT
jgi:hypothetical protein